MAIELLFDKPTRIFYKRQAENLEKETASQMDRAAQRGKLNLVVAIREHGTFLKIIKDMHEILFLADVIFAEELTLGQISSTPNPWELVIFEKPSSSQEERVMQIAKESQSFLRSFYPQAAGVQINFYDSVKSFRQRQLPIFQI